MTEKTDLIEALRAARVRGERPSAPGADLWGADLWGANLGHYRPGNPVNLGATPSGVGTLIPALDGWRMRVGRWSGTPDELDALIATDDGWPEAEGEEITRRRPYLQLMLAHARLVMNEQPDLIATLAKRWGTQS